MVLEQLSPGRREVVTSGGERDRRRVWTHDIFKMRSCLCFTVVAPHIAAFKCAHCTHF